MNIGVRYDVSNRTVIRQFHRAFDFWANIVDAEFHDERSISCSVAIVEGTKALMGNRAVVARAQLPGRLNFQGWIAVDPKAGAYLTGDEAVAIWIHEIGHLLGLQHNPSVNSLMYFIDISPKNTLDWADLRALSRLHTLRNAMPQMRVANGQHDGIPSASLTISLRSGSGGPDRVPNQAQSQ